MLRPYTISCKTLVPTVGHHSNRGGGDGDEGTGVGVYIIYINYIIFKCYHVCVEGREVYIGGQSIGWQQKHAGIHCSVGVREWWFNAVSTTKAVFPARICYCFKESQDLHKTLYSTAAFKKS